MLSISSRESEDCWVVSVVKDEIVGSELIYLIVEPAEKYERIKSSSAITRYLRSCETSRYKKLA